jgi:hypothetical protein
MTRRPDPGRTADGNSKQMNIPWQEKVADYAKRPAFMVRARRVDISKVDSVVMAIGPNRNMTTLTASLIALHPNCQVLNNAAYRHMERAEALLRDPNQPEYERFVRSSIYKSQGGRRGHYGGSITLSHAFDRPAVREAYERRFGEARLKDDIRCVYWKSAVQLTALLREQGLDLARTAEANPKVRFLMPMRNPVDCAKSNLRLGHYRHFPEVADRPIEEVVDFFVGLIGWFLDLRKRHPKNFFCYVQTDFGRQTLVDLAGFLGLPVDETWISDCLTSTLQGKPYDYEPELVTSYHQSLEKHLADHPVERATFASMVPA